jgi:tetratricopeptide (TPR) repeat protein
VKLRILLPLLMAFSGIIHADVSPADLLIQGRVDESIAVLNSRLARNPNADDYHLLCRAHFDIQDWTSAVTACQKASDLKPDSSREHLWLGRAYGEKADSSNFVTAIGLAKKVRLEFETAVRLDPSNAEARSDLAEFYLEAPAIVGGGQSKAQSQADLLMRLDASKAHWIQGRLAEKNKDFHAAENEYRAAIESSHGGGIDWLNLASFYKRQNHLDQMEQALHSAVAAPPTRPEVTVEASEMLIRAGRNLPRAVEWLQKYLSGTMSELAPAFKAQYLLGQAEEKRGNRAVATGHYRAALQLAKEYPPAQKALSNLG